MGELADKVIKAGQIGLDTSPFIYYFEKNPAYLNICREIFDLFEAGKTSAITSVVTLLEVLVQPLAQQRHDLVHTYTESLTTLPHLFLCQIDKEIAVKAAELRAAYKLKTADAIQISAAILWDAQLFLTNDPIFRRVKEIEVVILDDILKNVEDNLEKKADSGSEEQNSAG